MREDSFRSTEMSITDPHCGKLWTGLLSGEGGTTWNCILQFMPAKISMPLDGFRLGDGSARHLGMEALDHAAVHRDRASARVLRPVEQCDDLAGALDLFGGGSKDRVGRANLVRMDEGLAVEAEIPTLLAFGPEPVLVLKRVVDSVHDVEFMRPRGGERRHQPGKHRSPSRHQAGPGFLGEVVG